MDPSQTIAGAPNASGAPASAEDAISKVAWETLAAKLQGKHIQNYAGANLAYTHAMDIANKLGLTADQKSRIAPFPARPSSNVNIYGDGMLDVLRTAVQGRSSDTPQPSPEKSKAGMLPKLLTAGALVAFGGGVIPAGNFALELIADKLKHDHPPVTTPVEPIPVEPGPDGHVGFRVE